MQYRFKIPRVVEAITFEELVEHGRRAGVPIINGMPWSFNYQGQAISHEHDSCYVVCTKNHGTFHLHPDEMLITSPVDGDLYKCKCDEFEKNYEAIDAAHAA